MKRLTRGLALVAFLFALAIPAAPQLQPAEARPRARDLGIRVGILPPGPLNAITDVAGVLVGHTTIVRGDDVRTGVTAILPHGGNLFREKVPGAVFIGNAFGKLAGSTQVNELGEIETPILLTSTLSVPRVADALLDYMLALPGNGEVQSLNPLVGETNDGYLNDIRSRPITRDDVLAAIRGAHAGAVEEGAVGAGTGTVAFGFKGGIGSASRRLPAPLGGYTVGALVQSNFGGVLTIAGAPVGKELGRYYLKDELEGGKNARAQPAAATPDNPGPPSRGQPPPRRAQGARDGVDDRGSVIIVLATDAPVDARNLRRLAARALMGLARTGAAGSNGSGDYAIAFSTAPALRIHEPRSAARRLLSNEVLANEAMSPLFLAAVEATEEAIYNSLFRARTTTGRGHTVEALPIDRTIEILSKYRVIH